MKATVPTMAAAKKAMVGADSQPYSSPVHDKPSSKVVTEKTRSVAPRKSTFRCCRAKGNRSDLLVMAIATIATGTFTRKIQRQLVLSTMNPPINGPTTLLNVKMLVMSPMYLPRSRGATTSPMMAKATAIKPPPPMPCTPRATTNCHIDCAMPQRTEPAAKITIAAWKSRRRPYRSESFPKSGVDVVLVSMYAVPTHA
jgi:hypothetical protein